MKKIISIALVSLVLVIVLVSTSAMATTGKINILLNNPFLRLWNAIHNLQTQVATISINPGPQGETGPQGPAGNCSGTISDSDFQSLTARVDALENNGGTGGTTGGWALPDCIDNSDCDDNNVCTTEACDSVKGCVYVNNHNSCDDSNPSTVNDVCNAGTCNGENSGGTSNTTNSSGNSSGEELIVTEIMYNPDAVSDTAGEWFEVYNPGTSTVNLNGWTVMDHGTDSFTISEDLFIEPDSYAVLCKNNNITTNGGLSCDLEYKSFTLGNSYDAITLQNPESQTVDDVAYNVSVEPWKSLNKPGYSLQLDPSHYNVADSENSAYWCNTDESMADQDFGTPGAINSDCQ